MSRPFRSLLPVVLAASSLALAGCGTIYSDMYSPRRSRFVPPPPPATEPVMETAPIPPGDTTPLSPIPSSAPMAVPPPPPPPPIPGLDPIPSAPLPADPAAPLVPAPEMSAPGTPPLEMTIPPVPDPAVPPPPPGA